jgi:starch synthase
VKILLVTSEAVPFAKTGGLADVSGALPGALRALGHDIRVALPRYRSVAIEKFQLRPRLKEMIVHFTGQPRGSVLQSTVPGADIPVYFMNNDAYFDRDGLYGEAGTDYPDNAERFAWFSMATLWTLKGIDWRPDVIHCNDWQSALIPTYLSNLSVLRNDGFYRDIKTVYTIHNLAYQGSFPPDVLPKIGLDYSVFHPDGLEFYGKVNLMKAGIIYSDAISTVSRKYAEEIQTKEYGAGLDGVLRARPQALHGIMNGIDYEVWNPEKDPHILAKFSPADLSGKAKCKAELQKTHKLPPKQDIPVIGMISRLDKQKGFDLLEEAMPKLMKMKIQFVILGTGDPKYHEMLLAAAKKYPEKMAVALAFNNALAHQIEAGADMFLMPSRYEPCGLNQLYSLKYGTIPVVRKTGGLADSIDDCSPASLKDGSCTGFAFEKYDAGALDDTITRAVDTYRNKERWMALVQNAMRQDFSWDRSARAYDALFRKVARA